MEITQNSSGKIESELYPEITFRWHEHFGKKVIPSRKADVLGCKESNTIKTSCSGPLSAMILKSVRA